MVSLIVLSFTYSYRSDAIGHKSKTAALTPSQQSNGNNDTERSTIKKKHFKQIACKNRQMDWATHKHKILHSIYGNRSDNKSIYKHHTGSHLHVDVQRHCCFQRTQKHRHLICFDFNFLINGCNKTEFCECKKKLQKISGRNKFKRRKKNAKRGKKMAWHFRDCFALKPENVAFALGFNGPNENIIWQIFVHSNRHRISH